MRASLADQADAVAARLLRPDTLAIALGANLPSPAGEPADTLLAVRPHLEQALQHWAMALAEGGRSPELRFQWSPLVRTAPVGGPPAQSDYTNGVVLVALPAPLAVAGCRQHQPLQPCSCPIPSGANGRLWWSRF